MTVSSKRRNTGPDETTRNTIYARDRGCVACGDTYDLQIHHCSARRMGGGKNKNGTANLILLCAPCHRWVELNRETSLDRGLLVSSWQTPTDIALIRHGEWGYLDDAGGWAPCPDPTPDPMSTEETNR